MFSEVVVSLSEKLVVAIRDLQRVAHFLYVMNEYLLIIFI